MADIAGIYLITCLSSGAFYVGSTNNWRRRRACHLAGLRHNKHPNPKLQRAFSKYGEANFTFLLVEPTKTEFLLAVEQSYLDWAFHQDRCCLNIAKNAKAPGRGLKHSRETRRLLSAMKKGVTYPYRPRKPLSDEHKAKLRSRMLGRTATPSTKLKMAAAHAGKPSPTKGKRLVNGRFE